MQTRSKNVVIINNVNSKYIEQAIIILKSPAGDEYECIIEEAEKIIGSCDNRVLSRTPVIKKNRRKSKINLALVLLAAVAAAALGVYFLI